MSEVWSLPDYHLQVLLGFGPDGEVWRAVHAASGDVVALKRLRAGRPVDLAALHREADRLRRVDSPYLVRVRDVVVSGEILVVVLDHAAGGSLEALLARRSELTPAEVVGVGVPLAHALAAAHARGLVHGDLRPGNVLLTADGGPLLSDLAVNRVLAASPAGSDGTCGYSDPSLPVGDSPGPAADVWSLAAVLHHLLAGCPPDSTGRVAARAEQSHQRVPLAVLAPAAPPTVVDAVEAGLSDDPRQRPSAAAFGALLRRSYLAVPVDLGPGRPACGVQPGVVAAAQMAPEAAPGQVPADGAGGAGDTRSAPVTRSGGGARGAADIGGAGGTAVHRGRHRATRSSPGVASGDGEARRRAFPELALLAPLVVVVVLLAAAGVGWASGRGGAREAHLLPAPTAPSGADPLRRSGGSDGTAGEVGDPAPGGAGPAGPAGPDAAPIRRASSRGNPRAPVAGWTAVVDRLDAARSSAFASGDRRLLARVYVRGCPAEQADARAVRQLAARGWRAVGVRHRVLQVRAVGVPGGQPARVRLHVTDELAPSRIVDAAGRLVATASGRRATSFLVEMRRTPSGWRLQSVVTV